MGLYQAFVTTGWGTTSSGGSTSNLLKETTVKIVANSDSTCLGPVGVTVVPRVKWKRKAAKFKSSINMNKGFYGFFFLKNQL